MLSQTFTHFERQVQSSKIRIRAFEQFHHTQALPVVIEATMGSHTFGQHLFTGMAEGRMPEIVCERDRFRQIFIQR